METHLMFMFMFYVIVYWFNIAASLIDVKNETEPFTVVSEKTIIKFSLN